MTVTALRPRTRIEDLRRGELIAAAHRVFMQDGLSGLTTARICAAAGMSPGILSYYFRGKDEVLYAMVRMNNRALVQDVVARLRHARTRWDRLEAIIEGNFPVAFYERNVANAWLSVCAASAQNDRFARLQRLFHARLASNLASVFGDALDPSLRNRLILSITAQIDGFWLRKSTDKDLDRATAVAVILHSVAAQLDAGALSTLRAPTFKPDR
jgi:TetR/AcrR family transcriptional regulator, transcriptional repressor of bet genes